MPHSKPSRTSRTSSLKRFSVLRLPSWMTTLSRSRRTLAPRRTTPSVTMQPATFPTLLMVKTSRIAALPRKRSRRLGEDHVALVDAADRGMQHADRHLLGGDLFERAGDRLERALHVRLDDDGEL